MPSNRVSDCRASGATRNEDWPDSPTVKRNEGIKETKIMFCEKCGSPIKDDEKFCGKCGNAVVTNTDGVPEPDRPNKSSSGKMTIMLYCIGVVLFALAAIDYAGMHFDYDLTGVSWSPYAIGILGGVCISIAKKLNPPKTEDND